MAQSVLDLIIRTKKTGTGTKETEKGLKAVASGIKSVGMTMAAVVAAGYTFKKALDLGKEGAVILQTKQSFDRLIDTVDGYPDLLERLQKASRGTVDEMTLMSSTATLLAGAEGELATQLANATPQLMEMAKASNKLNPLLGDTTFLYESLATGIKRGSPMILDNLGITVSLGDANEAYAKALGKTVAALTEEEKKIALLNAVLEKGDVLIQQVGGSTESAVDPFNRLEAVWKDLADTGKTQLAPVMGRVANLLADLLSVEERLEDATNDLGDSYDEYRAGINALLIPTGRMLDAHGRLIDETGGVIQNTEYLTRELWELVKAAEAGAYTTDHEAQRLAGLNTVLEDTTEALEDTTEAQEKHNAALKAALEAGLDGRIQDAWDEYNQLVEEGTQIKGWDTKALEANAKAQEEAKERIAEHTKEIIYQNAILGLNEDAQLELARTLGLVSELDYEVIKATQELNAAYDPSKPNAYADAVAYLAQAAEDGKISAEELATALDILNGKRVDTYVYTHYITSGGNLVPTPGGGGGAIGRDTTTPVPFAEGGSFVVPPGFPNDSFKVNLALTSGEEVTVKKPGDTYNFYLTAEYPYRGESSLRDDIRMLEYLYGR